MYIHRDGSLHWALHGVAKRSEKDPFCLFTVLADPAERGWGAGGGGQKTVPIDTDSSILVTYNR